MGAGLRMVHRSDSGSYASTVLDAGWLSKSFAAPRKVRPPITYTVFPSVAATAPALADGMSALRTHREPGAGSPASRKKLRQPRTRTANRLMDGLTQVPVWEFQVSKSRGPPPAPHLHQPGVRGPGSVRR